MALAKTKNKKSSSSFQERVTKRKKERDLQAMRDIADDVLESDFVPYACLHNPHTIITKDGELIQTIKINGVGFAKAGQDLRQAIRRAINDCIPDASYGIWLHTLRRGQNKTTKTRFPDPFSSQVEDGWQSGQPASSLFSNELYITIVKAPQPLSIWSLKGFLKTLMPASTCNRQWAELEEMDRALSYVTGEMLQLLHGYGARRLQVVKRDNIYYSEQLEFLEKLINLEERAMPVPDRDLSHVLTSGEITFGFNSMEVRTAEGHRRFATILTLKEYKESTLAGIDKFLEIPCEVIVSQCFGFVGAEQAQEMYTRQSNILEMSGDKELAQWIEIGRLATNEHTNSYGREQTTLFLIAPSVKQLEANVRMVRRALSRLGMVVIREDLRFEDCYWAQLPGNFHFVARTTPVDTAHLAGFANLQLAAVNAMAGSPWGPPVSMLQTVNDTANAFNFQQNGLSHTIIIGKPGTGRTTLTHFLLAQSRKLPVRIWYLDTHQRAGEFLNAIGGSYRTVGTPELQLNPLQLDDNPTNRQFLTLWLSTLIDPYGNSLNQTTVTFLQSMIQNVMAMPKEKRRLSAVLPAARAADAMLASALEKFCMGGQYGTLFDSPIDNFAPEPLIGWDIHQWMKQDESRIPLTGYLLHRLAGAIDGQPTILVLDEGFDVLSTPLFSGRAAKWCEYLTEKNVACILTTESATRSAAYGFTSPIAQKAANILALADVDPDAEYAMGFGLTPEDIAALGYIDAQKHYVLQKCGANSVLLNMHLGRLKPALLETLSGRPKKKAISPAEQLAALMGTGAMAE